MPWSMKGKSPPSSRPTRLLASTRHLRQPLFTFTHHARNLKTVAETVAPISIEDFRRVAFQAQRPLLIRPSSKPSTLSPCPNQQNDANTQTNTSTSPTILPALTKWFNSSSTFGKTSLTPYLDNFRSTILPYELSFPNSAQVLGFMSWLQRSSSSSPTASSDSHPDSNSSSDSQSRLALAHLLKNYITHHSSSSSSEFLILDLPLHLLLLAHHYNMFLSSSQTPPNPPLTNLYIAQAPLSHLPSPLRSDLPTPLLVSHAGRGDIYSSSIWLGLQPTYTPWHRDPNPNLFCQLCGTKVLRLMAPKRGEALFRGVMASLAVAAGSGKIRGEEMMKGEQRRALERAVWAGDGEGADDMMYEVTVQAGDMLFMPLGWWHSVKSAGEEGGINGSVNWWFR
ncbi:hypothetical protein NEUTE1DRAFT_131913 [Neurospora tetrasperma FGSC 2508]|uniref:JmjC domain-containing protein n=1 Tax=Neurospora tetrasperma (strain FGSC 2508 / ATCC MYA-4615 / P0657) TaxID=510951 RepID=F8MXA2_NEUT8|nr:uncharacterized protein NEUTE1DRAFT_131913 [Neurospora tetrasperma FGSC 2508]EGO54373.1 hypothetical protein NEUTE1DRAFT_131913 [Neurospora tetrasperma FGSC 2508]